VDVDLLAASLPRGSDAWPKLEPVLKSCLESDDFQIGTRIADLYEKADAALAAKMEGVLTTKWKAVGDAKSTQAEKAGVIRTSMARAAAVAKISPQKRQEQLEKLTSTTLSAVKADQKKEAAVLRDAVRLAHASTMACALLHKEVGLEIFDAHVAQIPDIDQTDPKNPQSSSDKPDKSDKPKQPSAKGRAVDEKVIQSDLVNKPDPDPVLPGSVCREYVYALKAGQPYTIHLRSVYMNVHLRVEHPKGNTCGQMDDRGITGFYVNLPLTPTADGDYQIIVSSPDPGKVGKYEVQVKKGIDFGFGGGIFGPRWMPGIGMPGIGMPGGVAGAGAAAPKPAPKEPVKKEKQLNPNDIDKLDSKKSTDRVAGFESLAESVLTELTPSQAQKIAKYLLVTITTEDELEKVKPKLESLVECRPLMLALADLVGDENAAIAPKYAEAILGGVLAQPLSFADDKDWRSTSRTMLLQRALDLTRSVTTGADQAADFLRDLYKEQGMALGIEAPDFFALTRPTQVLVSLIKHVAEKAAKSNRTTEEKDYLEQVGRHLQAARFLAENDLEYMVLLQRVWIKVLALYLQDKAPAQVKAMARIQQELEDQDRRSSGVLDQLRAGEEKILQIWALANNLK
jgi:hypothetical protein